MLFLYLARTKRHMTLTSRGFHDKTGRFECSWSLFAALDYAVGSRGRVVMRMQVFTERKTLLTLKKRDFEIWLRGLVSDASGRILKSKDETKLVARCSIVALI